MLHQAIQPTTSQNRKGPLACLFLSLLCFFFVDIALFHSDLYARVTSPKAFGNMFFYLSRFEQARPPSGKNEILLLGNSRMGDSFSILDYEKRYPHSDLKFIWGMIPGSAEALWYYELATLDPQHNKYKAVVVPVFNLYTVTGELKHASNGDMIAPVMGWHDLGARYHNEGTATSKQSFLLHLFVRGRAYAPDIQDFIMHPANRIADLTQLYKKKGTWDYEREAVCTNPDGSYVPAREWMSMQGFAYDSVTGKILSWPDGIIDSAKSYIRKDFIPLPPDQALANTHVNEQDETYWLNRIIGLYAKSSTKVIFVQPPLFPYDLPSKMKTAASRDLRQILNKQDNVFFMGADAFRDLYGLQYFQDVDHLSTEGRDTFIAPFMHQICRIMICGPNDGPPGDGI